MIDETAHLRITNVESRLDLHFELIEKLQEGIQTNTSSLAENTRLTQEVATNTGEIVLLLKGGKVLGKLVVWLSTVAGSIAALWAIVKYILRGE